MTPNPDDRHIDDRSHGRRNPPRDRPHNSRRAARIGRRRFGPRSATGAVLAVTLALAVALPIPFAGGALADPPPWAPAYGYRAKHKVKKRGRHKVEQFYQQAYRAPKVGIPSGTCNRDVLGALIGGAVGGLAGSRIGQGDGRIAATAGGALIGLLVGGAIGRSMDRVDRSCIGQALEQAEDRRSVEWRNPDSATAYRVTPTRTYQQSDGRYCREYTAEATIGNKVQRTYGVACRQPDGSWKLGS